MVSPQYSAKKNISNKSSKPDFDNMLHNDQNEKLVACPLCAFYVKAFNL